MRSFKPTFGSPIMGGMVVNPLRNVNLTLDGNSLTALAGSYPEVLPPLLKPSYAFTVRNFAVSGQSTTAMLSDATTQIDKLEHKDKTHNIIFVWEGINDFRLGATLSQTYENIRSYCLGRKAYGFKVLVGTLTPSTHALTPVTYEAARLTVNTLIRTNWYEFADGIVDLGGNETLGNEATTSNLTYYYDKIHLTANGNAIVAATLSKAINLLLP